MGLVGNKVDEGQILGGLTCHMDLNLKTVLINNFTSVFSLSSYEPLVLKPGGMDCEYLLCQLVAVCHFG